MAAGGALTNGNTNEECDGESAVGYGRKAARRTARIGKVLQMAKFSIERYRRRRRVLLLAIGGIQSMGSPWVAGDASYAILHHQV